MPKCVCGFFFFLVLLRCDHSCGPQRKPQNQSEPILGGAATESGTHYDSLLAEMCWMVSESDAGASVRCHGDARAKCK